MGSNDHLISDFAICSHITRLPYVTIFQHLAFMTCLKQSPPCALRRVYPSILDHFPTATMYDDSDPLAYYCALFSCLWSHFYIRSHTLPPSCSSFWSAYSRSIVQHTSQSLVHCLTHSPFARSIHVRTTFVQHPATMFKTHGHFTRTPYNT